MTPVSAFEWKRRASPIPTICFRTVSSTKAFHDGHERSCREGGSFALRPVPERRLSTLIKFFRRFFRWSRFPYVDVFFKKRQGEGYVFSSSAWAALWPGESFIHRKELFPLVRYPFGPIQINGPSDPFPYLERAYGDWTTGKVKLGHHVPRCYCLLTCLMRSTIPVEGGRFRADREFEALSVPPRDVDGKQASSQLPG